MRVAIVSRSDASNIKSILKKNGFEITQKNPDFVISYGGDGTILYSERLYPSIPKLAIKTTAICRKCDYTESGFGTVLKKIQKKIYKIKEYMKLETFHNKNKLIALNEIQIRNKLPIRAMRFSLFFNNKNIGDVVADGVILSTQFGSTGYYKAAGGKPFENGIGICINNPSTDVEKSFVIPEDKEVKIKVQRDTAYLAADNYENLIELSEEDEILIRKSKEKARFIVI